MSWPVYPLALSALLFATGQAFAQVAPPTPTPSTPVTARGATATFAPGQPRADQPLTTYAYLGSLKGEPISTADVFRPIDAELRQAAADSGNRKDFEDRALPLIRKSVSDLASDILVVAAASSQLTENNDTAIDYYVAVEKSKLLAKYGGVESVAERAKRAEGSSIEKEMRAARRTVIKQIYFQKNLLAQVVVTQPMVMAAYNDHPERWKQIEQVELYSLTLPVTNWLRGSNVNGARGPILTNPTVEQIRNAEAQAVAEGNDIIAQLKAGADFARLVEDKNSRDEAAARGGAHGWQSRGSRQDAKLEDFIFSLPSNGMGVYLDHQPKFADSTMRVIKVGGKKAARTIPFDEAQATIYAELKDKQITDLERQEMAKLSVGSEKELAQLDRNLPLAVEVAWSRYFVK